MNCRFRRKRRRGLLEKGTTAYLYRGAFATDALENGVPIATVAELLGHQSTAMVSKHYSSLSERTEHLRKAAAEATKDT